MGPSGIESPVFTSHLYGSEGSLTGWVVVDSLHDGLAMGGTRMTRNVTVEEVAALARDMTHKFILAGLPIGGAKAGIVDKGADREATFRTFGRTIKPLLHGGVHLGIDLGVTSADRAIFFDEAAYDPRFRRGAPDMPIDWRTYYEPLIDATGYGVSVAAITALDAAGLTESARVVIQGFGAVGRAVAQFLQDRGHTIVGVADVEGTISADHLPVENLKAITDNFGRIKREQLPSSVTVSSGDSPWLNVESDLLVLAAQRHALNGENVTRLRAQIVVEGANIGSTTQAQDKLRASGSMLVPGVIANIGGAGSAALAVTRAVPFELDDASRKAWVFEWIADRVRNNTADILEIGRSRTGDPLPELIETRRAELRR